MEFPQQLRIAGYDIQRQLGRGSLGVVYQAWDREKGRTVALKVISATRPGSSESERTEFERTFVSEMTAVSTLSHPSIAAVYEAGVDARTRTPFLAIEHLRGLTVESTLATGHTFDWVDALQAVNSLADALHHAHTHAIMHGDVKPANVMALKSGGFKLMDFRLAMLFRPEPASGHVVGNPSYMSPEQALGDALDARSDVFSLGAVLYEMLTHTPAFPGENLAEILTRVISHDPPPVTRLVPALPRDVQDVLVKALAKEPGNRYESAALFRDDLQALAESRPPRYSKTASAPHASPMTLVSKGTPAEPKDRSASDSREDGKGTARADSAGPTLAFPPGKQVALAILDGPRKGEVIVLDRPKAVIGRAGAKAQSDIELDDAEVSRAHALVECHGVHVIVRDLASTNGTFIDDQRVAEADLKSGGEFRVGRTRIRLVISDAQP